MRVETVERGMRWAVGAWALAFGLVGCDDAADPAPGVEAVDAGGEACRPDEAHWDRLIQGKVDRYCGECHAATPQFGASVTLTDLAGALEHRETIIERLTAGTMPPPAMPQPPALDNAEIIAWASCTAPDQITPNPGGFSATADLLPVPPPPPPETPSFELRAFDFDVPAAEDHYECFNVEIPADEPRLLQRIEPLVDDSRVLHHIVLMRGAVGPVGTSVSCVDLDNQVYAWAPGMNALAFPEGGLRVEPREQFHLQIHYNNAAGLETVDRSGVRIFHGPVEGPVVGMAALGPRDFALPAGARQTVEEACEIEVPTTVLASWPHMHQLGAGFETFVIRADGTQVDLVTLDGWSFESQFIYSTPVQLVPGDRIMTRCHFENMTDEVAVFGPGTADEMCFNFMYHSPPLPPDGCSAGWQGRGYEPGPCLGPGDWAAEEVEGAFVVGMPPPLEAGALTDGAYVLESATVYLAADSPLVEGLDIERSAWDGAALLVVEGDTIRLDIGAELEVRRGADEDELAFEVSVAGTRGRDGDVTTIEPTCGEGPTRLDIAGAGAGVVLHVDGPAETRVALEFGPYMGN